MDQHGRVDLDVIAGLLGVDRDTARAGLGDLVFDDPTRILGPDREHPFELLTAAAYLSGNVRVKLRQAQQVAAHDPRFAGNVAALTAVIPADIPRDDIVVRLGAAWIDAPYVQQFLREILDDHTLQVEHPFGAMWTIKGREYGVAATTTWGTEDIAAPALAQLMATQSEIVVRDTIVVDLPDGATSERHPVNVTKTIAAQAKADELAERFAEWIWEDPTRAAALHRTYNDRFNAMVLRSYDGIELTLPGLALTAFKPKAHQSPRSPGSSPSRRAGSTTRSAPARPSK